MAGLWKRATGPFREFGLGPGLLYATDRVLRSISPRFGLYVYELMVQPITDKPLLSPNLAKNLTFGEIENGDPALARMPAREDIKALRYAQGSRCLGVYRKGVLIGYIWFCFNTYEEDEVRCTYELIEPRVSVFDYDLYLFPEHRMGIGFMAIWHCASQYLRARGVDYTFSRLTRFNLASRRSHAHLGWGRAGRAVFLQLGPVEAMVADLAPYVSLTWTRSQRVRLRLSPAVMLASGSPAQVKVESST